MKMQEMKQIKESRQDLVDFLNFTETNQINAMLKDIENIASKSFYEICDTVLKLYKDKLITNKTASNIFDILAKSNNSFKIESHRFECNKIYEYSTSHNAYFFLKVGSKIEFNRLNHYID